jgi:hypothetical protein
MLARLQRASLKRFSLLFGCLSGLVFFFVTKRFLARFDRVDSFDAMRDA